MTDEYPLAVREEAARRARAADLDDVAWTADDVTRETFGRALCKAVQDGCLHWDAVELDTARWEEAERHAPSSLGFAVLHYRRLVREGWTPPEPVGPVLAFARELGWTQPDDPEHFHNALTKLRLKLVPEDGQ